MDQWPHVQVIWWFDQKDTPQRRAILQVHPRGNPQNPLTGVLACRAPVRPNLIALSPCGTGRESTVERNSFRLPRRERNEFRSTMGQFGPREV